jgi:hypothetical protein
MSIAVENAPRWFIKISCRPATVPLPRWFLKTFFEFYCCDCIGPEILVLVHQIHLVSGCFICKHWNSTRFMQFFNDLEKNATVTAPLPRWFFPKPTAPLPRWLFQNLSRPRRHGHLWSTPYTVVHLAYQYRPFHCQSSPFVSNSSIMPLLTRFHMLNNRFLLMNFLI